MTSSVTTVGVFGKIAAQADFFRSNAGEFAQAGLDRWFESALETMRGEGGHLPDGPTAFVLAPRAIPRVFVGAFAPSTDAAGRSFPLVVFAHLDRPDLTSGWSALPEAVRAFIAAAGQLAVEGSRLAPADLVDRGKALAPLDPSRGWDKMAAAGFPEQSVEPLVHAVGGMRALAFALRTAGLACDQAAKYGPDAATGVITIDAPLVNPETGWLWAELIARRLHWRTGLPSLLWTVAAPAPAPTDRPPRLLCTLGPPSASAFGYLANPRHRSPRFWPLRTDVSVAVDQAMQALSAEQRRLIDGPATIDLERVLAAFAV